MNSDGANKRPSRAILDRSVSDAQWSRDGKGLYLVMTTTQEARWFCFTQWKIRRPNRCLGGQSTADPILPETLPLCRMGVVVTASITYNRLI